MIFLLQFSLIRIIDIFRLGGIGKSHGGLLFPTKIGVSKFVLWCSVLVCMLVFLPTTTVGQKRNSTSGPAAKLKERVYNPYTPEQIQVLEEFYCRNPHPDASDRKQLGEALGLSDDRTKYWFQNRRAMDKRISNKSLNEQLKERNDRLRIANETSKLTLLTATCDSGCMEHPEGGSSFSDIERLKLENAYMKDKIDKMDKQLDGIGRKYSPDPDDESVENQQPAEGQSNPGLSITEPQFGEIDLDLLLDFNEEAHQSLD